MVDSPRGADLEAAEAEVSGGSVEGRGVGLSRRVPWTPGGRWKWRMEVPGAEVVEMLPAVRLVSLHSGEKAPGDYSRAKALFLEGIKQAGVHAQELGGQLQTSLGAKAGTGGKKPPHPHTSAVKPSTHTPESSPGPTSDNDMMPALQNLTGHWRGTIQVHPPPKRYMTLSFPFPAFV